MSTLRDVTTVALAADALSAICLLAGEAGRPALDEHFGDAAAPASAWAFLLEWLGPSQASQDATIIGGDVDSDDWPVRAACLAFINAFMNASTPVERRRNRHVLEAQGLRASLEVRFRVRLGRSEADGSMMQRLREIDPPLDFRIQLDAYEQTASHDEQRAHHNDQCVTSPVQMQ